jgi:penicillin-binding protein 2
VRQKFTSGSLAQSFDRRSFVVGAIQGGIGLLLAARMGYIAVAENEKYEMEAESNRVNLSLIPPRRGWILDRNGSPLASNRADFRVDIIPERLADAKATVATLSELLRLEPADVQDLSDKLDKAAGFQPVQVADGLDYDTFAAISVRLPELPGVVPTRGFSRFYPTGPSVGHLIGYVGAASREEYEKEPVPLLVTPGFKLGKDGLEKQFEQTLRGEPGARRVEVTASGRIVRDLDMREDVQGKPIQLTIDGPLQDYAARRLGLESGSVVVLDCLTGDLLCMASMPSFDPNSFSDGIGRVEYQMLSANERVPLRNKVLKGLYPPGSTVKPMVAMSFLEAGLDPMEATTCSGGLRVGNRVFHCWNHGGHGRVDMAKGIYQSCDVYFYHFAQTMGMDVIAAMAKRVGLGQEFPLPVASQFFGTVPDPAWKLKKYGQPWAGYDTVNATIGQGYMLFNPLQLAVYATRIATGNKIMPRLMLDKKAQLREHELPRRPRAGHPERDERSGQRPRHRRPRAAADRRRADGRQDRHRASRLAQRRRRQGRLVEVPRPRPVHLLRPVRQAALCRRGGDRARRRLGRGLPDRARRDDVPVRSGERPRGAATRSRSSGAAPPAAPCADYMPLRDRRRARCSAGAGGFRHDRRLVDAEARAAPAERDRLAGGVPAARSGASALRAPIAPRRSAGGAAGR